MQGQPAKVRGACQPAWVRWGSLHLGASWEFLSAMLSWTSGDIAAFSPCQSEGTACTEPFPHPIPGFSTQGLVIHQRAKAQPDTFRLAQLCTYLKCCPWNSAQETSFLVKSWFLPKSCVSHVLRMPCNRILPDSKLQTASHAFLQKPGQLVLGSHRALFPSYPTSSP